MWAIHSGQWATIAGAVLTLVILEGLLSADNALVLAVMVRHLPKQQQRRALRYGIFGAFFFRAVAVLLATRILDYWQFEVVGGLYLLYLAFKNLVLGEDHDPTGEGKVKGGRGFWATVIGVELADIAFSIDSILAAVGLADELPENLKEEFFLFFSVENWVIYIGGVLGIIAMRFVAGYFLILLERFRGLAIGAYYLVAWIGVKLVVTGFHHAMFDKSGVRRPGGWLASVPDRIGRYVDMPAPVFWGGMGLIVVASLLYRPKGPQPRDLPKPEDAPLS